jgi:hypothetical protein
MPRRLALSFTLAIALAAPAIAGADEDIERTRICHPDFARAGRPSEAEWTRLKAEAMARAGLPWSERNDFELDHVVPRCLDGANDLSNLQLRDRGEGPPRGRDLSGGPIAPARSAWSRRGVPSSESGHSLCPAFDRGLPQFVI